MKYQVQTEIQEHLNQLLSQEDVIKALKFIEDDQEEIIQKQIELTLIPAPTFHEEEKANKLLQMFKQEGLSDCHIDEYGNVIGIRKGKGSGKTILMEAHIDTVFPLDTELNLRRENGWIYCPGIVDDTRGLASILSVIRGLNAYNIETDGDIQFVGTVQEEGMGALKGMEYYIKNHQELDGSISIDGPGFKTVTYQATGIQTYEIKFKGIAGHSFLNFGELANPVHAMGRAISKIADIEVPDFPRTTFEVTGSHSGSYEGIHVIQEEAIMTLNFRSNNQEELLRLKDKIFDCIKQACIEETNRWNKNEITYEVKHIMDVNAVDQNDHVPIVQAAMAISNYLGCEEPGLVEGGCCNSNKALDAGLPAVCLGGDDYDAKIHSIDERFKEENAFKCPQSALLLALMCTGSHNQKSIL